MKKRRRTKVTKQQHKVRDMNSKTVFQDPVLCSQFLRSNMDIPLLKDIRPEDIEDVSERYRPYLGAEFEADSIKQIRLRDMGDGSTVENGYRKVPLYLVSLIEHKSAVDYNVSMQLLRYMVCIWTEYGKEMERKNLGNPRNKSFRYPPILPLVYYEGTDTWTVGFDLKSRIWMSEMFEAYIPDFTYRLVGVHDYSNEELLSREDEMSLLMLINKVQSVEDWQEFLKLPREKINRIISRTSEPVLEIIASTIWSLCMKMNMTDTEALECVEKVKERKMGYLFENMKRFDIQAERRAADEARKAADEARKTADEARKTADEAKKKRDEMIKERDEMIKERDDAKQELQQSIVVMCQELGGTKELAIAKLQEKCGLCLAEAAEKVEMYWKVSL